MESLPVLSRHSVAKHNGVGESILYPAGAGKFLERDGR